MVSTIAIVCTIETFVLGMVGSFCYWRADNPWLQWWRRSVSVFCSGIAVCLVVFMESFKDNLEAAMMFALWSLSTRNQLWSLSSSVTSSRKHDGGASHFSLTMVAITSLNQLLIKYCRWGYSRSIFCSVTFALSTPLLVIVVFSTASSITYWFEKLWIWMKITIRCLLIIITGFALTVVLSTNHYRWEWSRGIFGSVTVALYISRLSIALFPMPTNLTSVFERLWDGTKTTNKYLLGSVIGSAVNVVLSTN